MTWHRLLAPCPTCGHMPALRLHGWLIEAARNAEDDQPILDFQCQRQGCKDQRNRRTTYVIAAHAIARAEPVKEKAA